MAFKILEKQTHTMVTMLLDGEIALNRASVSFSRTYKGFTSNKKYMKIYVDEEEGRIAFEPTNEVGNSFPLRWNDSKGSHAGHVSIHLPLKVGAYPHQKKIGRIVDNLIVIEGVKFFNDIQKKDYILKERVRLQNLRDKKRATREANRNLAFDDEDFSGELDIPKV